MKKKCYNCGIEFDSKELTKEHIPPRCFSDAYPDKFKKNRMTVPCCNDCNNEFSKIDSELRDAIAIVKDGKDGNASFLEKGVKSIVLKKKKGSGFKFLPKQKTVEVGFDYDAIEKMFLKCHKGVFYDRFRFPVDEKFVSQANQKYINEKHRGQRNQEFENLHKSRPESFVESGHPDIFRFSMLAFKVSGDGKTWEVTNNIEECFAISTYMVFHETIDCVVVSVKKGTTFFEKIKGALGV